MQQQRHSRQAQRWLAHRPALLTLLGAAALLAMLIMAGWGSARAAPASGAPSLTIISVNGNILTLQFDNWTPNETITLSYAAGRDCITSQALPNATFTFTTNPLRATYTWPSSGIQPGTYYLCATASEGTIPSAQTITVTSTGTIQPAPGTAGATPTSASGTPTPGATSSPGAAASPTPGAGGTPGASSTPGNQGTAATASNSNSNTLIAIILLCLLVMALLAYLIRIWLQGRQPRGQPPTGGQQGP
jgi:hypothetical protein